MKILLIGEFSGVHNNLKKGLIELGHEVKLAADGDGFKNFGYDFRVAPHVGTFTGKIKNIIYILRNIRKFIGYDVVQFINPFSLPYYYSFFLITYIIFKFNKKSFYYACGTDPAFLVSKEKFEYFPFDDPNDKEFPKYNLLSLWHYRLFIKLIDTIVPAMYTYAVGYWNNPKLTKPIPLPGSGNTIKEIRPVGEKLKVLFGITRKSFKGAEHILSAIQLIKKQYSNKFEFIIVEKLPFTDYHKLLTKCDILIDQCKSYDYGMNAIVGMENGLIVLSGSEPIANMYLNIESDVIINIKPSKESIFKAFKILDETPIYMLNDMKFDSLNHFGKIHDLKKISYAFYKEYL